MAKHDAKNKEHAHGIESPASKENASSRTTKKAADLKSMDYAAQTASLSPLGAKGEGIQFLAENSPGGDVHAKADKGLGGAGTKLPHAETIQSSFGKHDVSGVQAHTGEAATAANQSMGSKGFAKGNQVAFNGSPDLFTAAHEAAHVVQQKQGVSLKSQVGESGDAYEKHADAVATQVVSGQSAESLLDQNPGSGGATTAVQHRTTEPEAKPDQVPTTETDDKKKVDTGDPAAQLKAYEAVLGKYLGGKLYDLVMKHLAPDKVVGYAKDGLHSGVDSGIKAIGDLGKLEDSEKEALQKFLGALAEVFTEKADAWLESDDGLAFAAKATEFAGTHPKTIVLTALLAAAGAIAADMDIPEFDQTFNITKGLSAGVKADVGSLRNIALNSLSLSLNYQASGLKVGAEYNKDEEGNHTGNASVTVGDEETYITTTGTLDKEGALGVAVDAQWLHDAWKAQADATGGKDGIDGATAAISHEKDGVSHTAKTNYVPGEGFTLNLDRKFVDDLWTFQEGLTLGAGGKSHSMSGRYGTDNQFLQAGLTRSALGDTFDLSGRYGDDKNYFGGSTSLGPETSSFGMDGQLSNDILKLHLDATISDLKAREGSFSVDGTVKTSEHSTLSADAKMDLFSGEFLKYGVKFGYEDPDSFRKFMIDYHREKGDGVSVDKFSIMAQERLSNRFSLGAYGNTSFTDNQFDSGAAGVLGGIHSNIGGENVTWLMGAEQQFHGGGESSTVLQAGVQIRKVPILLKYDPKNRQTSIGISIFTF